MQIEWHRRVIIEKQWSPYYKMRYNLKLTSCFYPDRIILNIHIHFLIALIIVCNWLKGMIEYHNFTKLVQIMILIVLCFSTLSPVTIVSPHIGTKILSILTLDVCHISGDGIFINPDTPFIYECPFRYILLRFAGFYESLDSVFNTFLIAFQKEHPPRVWPCPEVGGLFVPLPYSSTCMRIVL